MTEFTASERADPVHQQREVLRQCVQLSERIPGWTRGDEAEALVRASLVAPDDAIIVEVGCFLGRGTVLLASARQVRGSGRVHCVDPFDASGDAVSVPHYEAILLALWGSSQRQHFADNLKLAGVADWVEVHQGSAEQIAAGWSAPVDLLFLDADHSPEGARLVYESWSPWLKPGGVIAVHNSDDRDYKSGHDGNRLIAVQEIVAPRYEAVRCVGTTTFARKAA